MSDQISASQFGKLHEMWAPSPGQSSLLRAAFSSDPSDALTAWHRWRGQVSLKLDRLEPGCYGLLAQVYCNLVRSNTIWKDATLLKGIAKKQWLTLQLHRHALRRSCLALRTRGIPLVVCRGRIASDPSVPALVAEPVVAGQIAVPLEHTPAAVRLLRGLGFACRFSIRRAIVLLQDRQGGLLELVPTSVRCNDIAGDWHSLWADARREDDAQSKSTLHMAEHQRLLSACAQLRTRRAIPTVTTLAQAIFVLRSRATNWTALERNALYPKYATELAYCLSYVHSSQLATGTVSPDFLSRCLRRPIQRTARRHLLARLCELCSQHHISHARIFALCALGQSTYGRERFKEH